ncbi:MAG: hypothetical protein QOK42_1947 [Frankiaceae bacterium]|nr:hypothetical protein [Frankiaceae bacterium]
MTETLTRPRRTGASAPEPVPSLVPVAALAATGAAALGLLSITVIVLLAWVTAAGSAADALEATRLSASGWLLAHRVPLKLPAGTLALPPLGLTVLPVVLLFRWGAWVSRTARVSTAGRAVQAVLAMAASYAVLLGLVAGAAAGVVVPSAIGGLLAGWLLAMTAGGVGVLHGAGLLRRTLHALPLRAQALAAGTTACLAGLLAGGALVVGVSLVWHADRALHLTRALDAGVVGGVALCLLGLAYAPTAAVWGAAYALGTGFAVGAGTSVGPFATHVGAVPALPLLAGLPGNGTGFTVGAVALAFPFVAGFLGGAVLGRRGDWETPEQAALWGALLGPCTAVAFGVLSWVASGAAGPGRFASVGPSPWQVALAAGLEFALAGSAGAWEARRRLGT